jgi:hypothetical protein
MAWAEGSRTLIAMVNAGALGLNHMYDNLAAAQSPVCFNLVETSTAELEGHTRRRDEQ